LGTRRSREESNRTAGERSSVPRRRMPLLAVVTFLLLAAAIMAIGRSYYAAEIRQAVQSKLEDLAAAASFKADQIQYWRRTLLGCGSLLARQAWFSRLTEGILKNPRDGEANRRAAAWCDTLRETVDVDSVVLADGAYRTLARSPATSPPSLFTRPLLSQALRSGHPILSEFYSNDRTASRFVISLIVPVLLPGRGHSGAGLILRLDPTRALFPMIQASSLTVSTAKTSLVRRQDDRVLFLNQIRFRSDEPLAFSLPLSQPGLPAARAARGETGRQIGLDYRGVTVLAAYHPVSGTPWSVVIEVDKSEILAPLKKQALIILAVAAGFILLMGTLITLVAWRYDQRVARIDLAAEKERRAMAERFALLSRYANDVIFLVDESDRFIEANEKAVATYGYTREELLTLRTVDVRAIEERPLYEATARQAALEGGMIYETVHRRKDGTTFPVEISLRLIKAEGGRRFLAAIRDISERKAAEEERRRTAELLAANRQLIEVDNLKSMFIASMSHELRTPLNSIIGFSAILLEDWLGPLNGEQRENLSIIHRAGNHLLALINDVIDVSKIEAGMLEIHDEPFDAADVVQEAVRTVAKEARDKGLELEAEAPAAPFRGDRRRLLQIVLNLAGNAIKYTERGRVSIVLKPRPDGLEIAVSDTGIGVAPEDVPRLFLPFIRLDSPLRSRVPGTGLGLYLTKKLAEQAFHGHILVESRLGEGSRFTLRIPNPPARGTT